MRTYVVPRDADRQEQQRYAEVLAVHAALLRNGKVLYFGGDQHDPGQFAHLLFDQARLYDCQSGLIEPCTPAPGISDLFCAGHALLPDGRLLIAGGTSQFDPFLGDPAAWIFEIESASFEPVKPMRDGRWYPTLVTLADGDVLAVSGLNAGKHAPEGPENEDQNRHLELFRGDDGGGSWSVEGTLVEPTGTLYPRVHLLPDGRLFFVTPIAGKCATWRPGEDVPRPVCGHPLPRWDAGFAEYTSVLLPLLHDEGYKPRILVGNLAKPKVIDVDRSPLEWRDTGERQLDPDGILETLTPPRVNGMLVLLPTGDVLACGGEADFGDEQHPIQQLELYRAETNAWTTLPARTRVTRGYHSVALLLPDGRVWLAGSNIRCDWSFHDSADFAGGPQPTSAQQDKLGSPVDNRELRIEVFEPWYATRTDRPTLTIDRPRVAASGRFTATTDQADAIVRVALLRAGSTTHAFNFDQRCVSVPFTREANDLLVELPGNANVIPPGPWLVFLIARVVDGDGNTVDVPSEGRWLIIEARRSRFAPAVASLKRREPATAPINTIDPELLERQRSMEGMHHGGVTH